MRPQGPRSGGIDDVRGPIMAEGLGTFVAVFLFPDEASESFSKRLPVIGAGPPAVIRAAAAFEGAAAMDVYRLVDASAWPGAAAYLYAETVPRTLADGDGDLVQQISTPDD
ncbi:hypothetical protein [Leifsonia sp. Leaf336]|uniref:hypothetical protein n=1 Tax=Leifsonia sp. Leaf336 TaxID=1736341 RepID=UPI000AEAE57B|nr:hypothetical protein [Leifsonia sp. Leaf336]